jgi:hypothetical protein
LQLLLVACATECRASIDLAESRCAFGLLPFHPVALRPIWWGSRQGLPSCRRYTKRRESPVYEAERDEYEDEDEGHCRHCAGFGDAVDGASVCASPRPLNQNDAPYDAYAKAYGPQEETIRHRAEHRPHRSCDVYSTNNRFVGRDPDPNVRDMIARDRSEQFGSGF